MTALALDSTAWLALSLSLVALSTTAVLVMALPAVVELGRAARSAEKLFDTLNRELPPVLDAMRATGQELSELTDGVGEGVERASQLVQQVDDGVSFVKQQAGQVKQTSGSVWVGVQAAWRVFRAKPSSPPPSATIRPPATQKPSINSKPPAPQTAAQDSPHATPHTADTVALHPEAIGSEPGPQPAGKPDPSETRERP